MFDIPGRRMLAAHKTGPTCTNTGNLNLMFTHGYKYCFFFLSLEILYSFIRHIHFSNDKRKC